MNLIEQLGGYYYARKMSQDWKSSIDGDIPLDTMMYSYDFGAFSWGDLQYALLAYRRQHHIFEEFDMLVYMEISDISKIYRMVSVKPNSEGYIWMMGKGGLVYENIKYLTHATDEEIQAGKRL